VANGPNIFQMLLVLEFQDLFEDFSSTFLWVWASVVSFSSGVRGRAPATIEFSKI